MATYIQQIFYFKPQTLYKQATLLIIVFLTVQKSKFTAIIHPGLSLDQLLVFVGLNMAKVDYSFSLFFLTPDSHDFLFQKHQQVGLISFFLHFHI